MPGSRKGFTLIELLVVIAIIAALVALLFPAARSVMRKSLDAKCASNLRTLHVGMASYAGEWGHWPTQNREDPSNPAEYGGQSWYYSLLVNNYIPARKEMRDGYECLYSDALVCPANKVNKGRRYPWTASPYPWESNYASNDFWGDHYGSPLTIPGSRDRVRFPAGVENSSAILLVDSLLESWMYPGNYYTDWSKPTCIIPRDLHGEGAQALLANGAVILLTPKLQPDLPDEKYWNPAYVKP